MLTKERLIVALDVDGFERAKELMDILYPTVRIFKIGSELFTSCGLDIMKVFQRKGAKVFLDLKFHDIPNTVSGAVRAATRLNVFMLTVHASGGADMLKGAVRAAKICAEQLNVNRPRILGVTVLTSMDNKDLKNIGINKNLESIVLYLAKFSKEHHLDGVVASAREISHIRKAVGKDFIVVAPGIRPKGSTRGDQKRVLTPAEAIKRGADYIVVGRPIIEAQDPKLMAEEILAEMKNAEKG